MAIQMFPLGPPAVDTFSMISNLGKSFFDAYDAQRNRAAMDRKWKAEDEADKINADYAKSLTAGLAADTPAQPSRAISEVGKLPSFAQTNGRMSDPNGAQKEAFDYFVAKGYSPAAAAGIVGNFVQESRLNPMARNPGDGRDGSDSIGIAQWNSDRANRFKQFAMSSGRNPYDLRTQLDFVDHELKTTEGRTGRALQNVNDPVQAAGIVAGYLRPAGWRQGGDPSAVHGWGNRSGSAASIYDRFGRTQVASASPGLGYAPDTQPAAPAPQPVPFEQAIPGAMQFASLGGVGGAPTMPAPQMAAPAPQPAPQAAPAAPPPPAPVQMAQAAPAAPVASAAQDPIMEVLRRLPPQQQQWYVRALSNRITAPAAMQRLQSMVRQDKWTTTQAPNGQLIQTNERGEIRPVQGFDKPQDRWQYQEQPNGDLIGTNAATGKREVLNAGERDAVLRQYDRAKREGFQGGIFDFKRLIAEAGASRTNVNTNPGPAAAVYKSMEDRSDQARSAANALPSFAEAKRLIDSGQIILGAGADMRLAMTKIGALLGMDGESAANTETFRSTVAPTVLALVKGLGAGSGISNADREFAEKAAGGNINLEPTAIKRLMEIGVKAAEAKVKQHNALIDKIYPESDPQNAQVRALFRVDVPENYPEPEKPAEKPKETAPAKGADRKPLPDGYSAARALDEAKKAIKAGRDPEGVKERLRQHGIDPKRLEE